MFVALLVGIPMMLEAQTEIWTKITATPGAASLTLAVAGFCYAPSAGPDLVDYGSTTREVLIKDLGNSLFFKLKEPPAGKIFSADPSRVDFKGWASTGASVLIAADVVGSVITLRLYDLLAQRLLVTKDYTRPNSPRLLGHRLADEIVRFLTGEQGVAQTRIVFARRVDQGRELYTIDQDGQDLVRLTTDRMTKLSPDWSPDADHIAYSCYYRDKLVIFNYSLTTRSASLLCDAADMNDTPAWSPDARQLAAALSTESGMEIYVMDAAGRGLRRVTYNNSISTSPAWSPNGAQLLFVSDRAGSPQIYVINADGSAQRRLTFEGGYNTSPAWSPRGDVIAYARREGYTNQIFITDPEGETWKQLTFSGNNVDPCFSPDGLHIAFVSDRAGAEDIWVMNWDGTDQRRLTSLGNCSAPSWSPPLSR